MTEKYHGAREGYDPKKLDKRRTDGTLWPFKFKPYEQKAITVRHPKYKAFKKRPLHRRRKHGRHV